MNFKYCFLFVIACLLCFDGKASEAWNARWVTHPDTEPEDYAVLHFRNSFQLSEVPNSLELKVSADIRYMLYVNGAYIGQGPANNDLRHYAYDEQDIAGQLVEGENVIAITVFSLADMNPLRYESSGAKLIVQAKELGESLNTGSGNWKVSSNKAYSPTIRGQEFEINGYFAMGGGEKINTGLYPWNWKELGYPDTGWALAMELRDAKQYGSHEGYGEANLSLQASTIPAMDESPEEKLLLRSINGKPERNFIKAWQENKPLVIPKNSEITFLLDQSYLTKGFPFFVFSGGKDAQVEISYAETLFIPDSTQGHRDIIEGKEFIGLTDIYFLDGGQNREFSPLLTRVWRYMQVKVKTANEPLSWDSYRATKFIYPFQENAVFSSGEPLHKDIWTVGWRTARLCADETYMDCPYYEQLQYIGDTRVQALISLYVSGDDRLMKNAIDQFAHSITDEGITQSRFPSSLLQYIPPYSLFWINMIHDYHMHRQDDAYTAAYLNKISSILFWFEDKLREDKLLGPMPWWSYVDVVESWPKSSPPGSWEGGSMVLTLQYVYALQEAIALFEYHEKDALSQYFTGLKNEIQQRVIEKGYNQENALFADTPAQDSYSQHANILAILTNTAPVEQHSNLFKKITTDPSVSKTNLYWTFYLNRAAQKSGNGEYFLTNLDAWENMLEKGLSTFAESEQNTRSDCHAWSASPNYEFLNTVCGIQPASPHFETIKIAPNPGSLPAISGKMPHPKGEIGVEFAFKKDRISGEIHIPEGTKATLHWKGKEMALEPGLNKVKL